MPTVLIADDNRNWTESLRKNIETVLGYQVTAVVTNGQDALTIINDSRPDIIILDIVMPKYDGVYISNYVRTHIEAYYPVIYIISGMGTDSLIKSLNEIDITYFSMKPVAIEAVIENLRKISEAPSPPASADSFHALAGVSAPHAIRKLVVRLGLTPNRPSTQCVIDALLICIEKQNNYRTLTKILYPDIARQLGTNAASVERNIRSAVSQIKRRNTELFQNIFAYSVPGKITNSEFLSIMTDYMLRVGIARHTPD